MRLLITGGCGFLGSNLAEDALTRRDTLLVADDLSRLGSKANLKWLRSQGLKSFKRLDVRSPKAVEVLIRAFKPEAVFHLAGQVAMTTSVKDPRRDFEVNALGGLNVLEAVRRHAPKAVVIYSSTNKVYGGLSGVRFRATKTRYVAEGFPNGFAEDVALDFQSPYGCSKGTVDQYMLDYYRMYGLRTVVFRHSSIFGGRQFSTEDQGWVGWFASQAVQIARGRVKSPLAVSGDGKQVRDVLFASDIVECYRSALTAGPKAWGEAFNIGGGMPNSLSLLELFAKLSKHLGIRLTMRRGPWRPSDQKVFVADITKARRLLKWCPRVMVDEGLSLTLKWFAGLPLPRSGRGLG